MDKKAMLHKLSQFENEYIAANPKRGHEDISLARASWKGSSIPNIAMEFNCSESTVYRAIQRVKKFLYAHSVPYDILRKYVVDNPPNYGDGDAHSILDMLFLRYEESNRFDTEEIRNGFHELYQKLDEMSLQQLDQVIYTTCGLCRSHEMAGFVEGVKVGVRMSIEFCS